MTFLDFLELLQARESTDTVFNPWRDISDTEAPDAFLQRCLALALHLDCKPLMILVGEAPGYQGCRVSGIPFTSHDQLRNRSIPRQSWTVAHPLVNGRIWKEPSATQVWKTLYANEVADRTVLWNAFPWHPHRPGEPLSNRTPTRAESEEGRPLLLALAAMYPGVPMIAIGNVAHESLKRCLGLPLRGMVRHPSYGGAPEFKTGLSTHAIYLRAVEAGITGPRHIHQEVGLL